MTVEIFLKAFLVQEKNLNEGALKKLGHKIDKLAEECFGILPSQEFAFIRQYAGLFPDVSARYDGPEHDLTKVWEAFFLAQLAGVTVARHYSGRDTRPQIAEQR